MSIRLPGYGQILSGPLDEARRWKVFSIICVFNNSKKLDQYLIKSLEQQTVPFELITIDNTEGNYRAAAPVLNQAAKSARHEYLMFVHQDVALDSKDWLAGAASDMKTLDGLGAAGVAGRRPFTGLVASVTNGVPPRYVGWRKLKKPVNVQTLDGCLMIVHKQTFSRVCFDEETVDGWYLYVTNYCLDLIRHGYKNYVLPHHIYHESSGFSDGRLYQNAMDKIIDRHRDHVNVIYTTVGKWKTRSSR